MPSIGVLEHFQNPSEQPARRIKKSGGQSLVNRGVAFWVKPNVLLKMRERAEIRAMCSNSTPNRDLPRARYIPDKLPANIDYQLGLVVQVPALPNQIRFRSAGGR